MAKKSFLMVCFVIVAAIAFAVPNYPKPVGYVNDFANIMSAETKQQTETRLRDYRQKTSIEVAVVTVLSLEGETVEDYTLGLAQSWGVGDKKKDNGVVLLVAPNERKMRIEVGYGMESDLTDVQSGRIIRDIIIPYFKESVDLPTAAKNAKLTKGIMAGIDAILTNLGIKPFEARLEERKIAAEKAAAEQKLQDEQVAAFLSIAIPTGLAIIVLIVIGIFIYKAEIRRKYLKNIYDENIRSLVNCENYIKEAEQKIPKAREKLEQLQKTNPKEVWSNLENRLNKLPADLESQKKKLALLQEEHRSSDRMNSETIYNKIVTLLTAISTSSGLLEAITNKIQEVNDAKATSSKLIDSVPDSIKAARKELEHKDVKGRSRKYLDQAEDKYRKARSAADNQSVNWLLVVALFAEAMALVASAKSKAKSDKEDAEEKRHPRPKRNSYSSSSNYSNSSNWSSSSSSGSSSFGGFGGGSFGGGGASGSW